MARQKAETIVETMQDGTYLVRESDSRPVGVATLYYYYPFNSDLTTLTLTSQP